MPFMISMGVANVGAPRRRVQPADTASGGGGGFPVYDNPTELHRQGSPLLK